MSRFLDKTTLATALAVSIASLGTIASAQTNTVPMGPTKAGPNAAVTGSSTAAGNSGGPAPGTMPAGASASKASTDKAPASKDMKLSSGDRKFLMEAAQGGMAEVEAGKLAAQKGTNADVKRFGERMATDHGKANDELKQLASSKGVALPDAPTRTQQRLAKQLQNLSGDRFDQVYAREAGVKDHKHDVAEFTREAQKAKDPDVRAFAAKTLPTLQEHLQMAQAMEASVSGGKK